MVDRPKKPLHSSPAWCAGGIIRVIYRGTGELLTGMRVAQRAAASPVSVDDDSGNCKQAILTPLYLPWLYSGTP